MVVIPLFLAGCNNLKSENEKLKEEITDVNTENEKLRKDLNSLKSENSKMHMRVAQLHLEIAALHQEIQNRQKDLDTFKTVLRRKHNRPSLELLRPLALVNRLHPSCSVYVQTFLPLYI